MAKDNSFEDLEAALDEEIRNTAPGRREDVALSTITKRVDELLINDEDFITGLTMEVEEKVGRMRHRATMLRERANEMDSIADELSGPVLEATIKTVKNAAGGLRHIEEMLRSLAHVEPQRVDTNGEPKFPRKK